MTFTSHSFAKSKTLVVCFLIAVPGTAGIVHAETPREKAWAVLQDGLKNEHAAQRSTAVRVLGLLPGNLKALDLATQALKDEKDEVRASAAYALGSMGAKSAILKLREALNDKETLVVLTAAQALLSLGDKAGYEVYYAILTGERKSKPGLIAGQEKMLKDPKKMAEFGFEQGIGFIPFAGLGWGAVKALTKDDVSPVRAAAAKVLANDPDPRSGEALADAAEDKSWTVRVAALEAIAKRGDRSLIPKITAALDDDKEAVRYTAAAAVLRLSSTRKLN
jgi:HEAT repeat protein